MALRLRNGIYFVYWREGQKTIQRSLKTSDPTEAERLHALYMHMLKTRNQRDRLLKDFPELSNKPQTIRDSGIDSTVNIPIGGLSLHEMKDELEKIAPLDRTKINCIARFVDWCISRKKINRMREVTPFIANEYLEANYSDKRNYKSFNNNRSILNKAFSMLLVPANMQASPFFSISMRSVRGVVSHRALTDDEFRALLDSTKEQKKRVLLCLGFFAGCDYSTASSLRWDEIDMNLPMIRRRRVKSGTMFAVGVHPMLMAELKKLQIPDDKTKFVIGGFEKREYEKFRKWLNTSFKRLDILDTDEGKASFHSLRSSFFTRCDRFGISRRTANLAGGHISDRMTDIYSHDATAALEICDMPWRDEGG